jgi:hypothetical protein
MKTYSEFIAEAKPDFGEEGYVYKPEDIGWNLLDDFGKSDIYGKSVNNEILGTFQFNGKNKIWYWNSNFGEEAEENGFDDKHKVWGRKNFKKLVLERMKRKKIKILGTDFTDGGVAFRNTDLQAFCEILKEKIGPWVMS